MERQTLIAVQSQFQIVGRELELEGLAACFHVGRHVLIEGPVGVGKTLLALALAHSTGRDVFRVDGDGRYTEQKLVGHFDPPAVLSRGYQKEGFVPGPLAKAMLSGGVLFINELNRMPEGVQNVLLPVLDEGLLEVPHLETLRAAPHFLTVATMNPAAFVATGHLSEALLDRFERIVLGYSSEAEEREIVRRRVRGQAPDDGLIEEAVALVRLTRNHPAVRRGASIRAAIAIVELSMALGGRGAFDRAVALALPNRIELHETGEGATEHLLSELLTEKKKRTPLKKDDSNDQVKT